MSLETYRNKRNFRITPEPKGRRPAVKQRGLEFVVQKHAASHLHYDFRLELNGVLLSWAVPKGPSLDPNDKRLAMHVEDHPMEYGKFEGVIPAKQYGAGTVLLWDQGVWVPKDDPAASYKKGRLKFDLAGEKLRGGWTLVRTHSQKYGGDKAWLLIKEEDEFARKAADTRIVDDQARSVATGRTMEDIAAERDRVWNSNKSASENVRSGAVKKRKTFDPSTLEGAVKTPMPRFVEPQLATLVKSLPSGDNWISEIKFDGYRMLCRIEDGEARLYSRNDKEWTANFPSIAHAAAHLPVENAWLDGEVVTLDAQGRSSFQTLQNALSRNDESILSYFLFDIPYMNNFDLRKVPLLQRKKVLENIAQVAPSPIHLSFHQPGRGEDFFAQACKLGLEGMILKMPDSRYSGTRSRSWLKLKCGKRQEMVIGGYTDPEGSRQGFGALLMGVYEDGALKYSGKVGTGFDDKTLADLRAKLDKLSQAKPPFIDPPRGAAAARSHWVKPELVAEIAFTEWTDDGTLRHPSFQGLRLDKKPAEVVREQAIDPVSDPASEPEKDMKPAKRGRASAKVELSHPDKVFYPETGLTKQDLANYYESISEWILPHIKQRPLSLLRCPDGWGKECFYQKNVGRGVNEAIERVKVTTSEGPAVYMMANSAAALVGLVQMGVLEIHPWGSTAKNLGKPDRIIFDFDPDDDLPWKSLVEAVRLLETLLDKLKLRGFLKTTGGKGLHVVVPIQPTENWAEIKAFSKAVAELFAATFPDRFTAKISKAGRHGKIFIDYLRNDEGSTAIAPYSTRARAKAPVSMPISWSELSKDVRFDRFNVKTAMQRLKRLKKDPWEDFFEVRQSIDAKLLAKVGAA